MWLLWQSDYDVMNGRTDSNPCDNYSTVRVAHV